MGRDNQASVIGTHRRLTSSGGFRRASVIRIATMLSAMTAQLKRTRHQLAMKNS